MKATGIIRRIDDLGRVVIPKEIRRTCGIREGDPLEIFREGDYICFKKNSESKVEEVLNAFEILSEYAFDEGGYRMKEMVDELRVDVEEKLKEIFV